MGIFAQGVFCPNPRNGKASIFPRSIVTFFAQKSKKMGILGKKPHIKGVIKK
jgi:hypothetical protein